MKKKQGYPRKCATKFCRGRVTETDRSPICSKCRARRWKERYPLKYAFNKLRNRAKERGHEFDLTFEDYERFALSSGYAFSKGKHAFALSIDRINPSLGYLPGNIQCLTLSENSRRAYVPQLNEDPF